MTVYHALSIALLCSLSSVVQAGEKTITNKLNDPIIILLKGEKDDNPEAEYLAAGEATKINYKGKSVHKFEVFDPSSKQFLFSIQTAERGVKCNDWLNTKDSFDIIKEDGVIKGVAYNSKSKKDSSRYVMKSNQTGGCVIETRKK